MGKEKGDGLKEDKLLVQESESRSQKKPRKNQRRGLREASAAVCGGDSAVRASLTAEERRAPGGRGRVESFAGTQRRRIMVDGLSSDVGGKGGPSRLNQQGRERGANQKKVTQGGERGKPRERPKSAMLDWEASERGETPEGGHKSRKG